MFRIIDNEQNVSEEDDESFSDSTLPMDVDEEEWEDLKIYAIRNKKLQRIRSGKSCTLLKSNLHDEPNDRLQISKKSNFLTANINSWFDGNNLLNSDNIHLKIDDGRCKMNPRKTQPNDCSSIFNDISDVGITAFNISSQQTRNEGSVVSLLIELLEKEDPNFEEVFNLLNSHEVTKQQLIYVWSELTLNTSRLCLCSILANDKSKNVFLCQKLLLPWFDDQTAQIREIVQKVSDFLPKFSDVAVKNLILPIFNNATECNNNPFRKDIYLLQDIMSKLGPQYWTLLFKELLTDMTLEEWNIPFFKLIIESMDNDGANTDNLNKLLHLMNSVLNEFSNNRNFGLLIISLINKIIKTENTSLVIIKQLTNIGENYKGSMRFKIMNSIKKIPK
ncbi:uncharacterized protein LOC142332577 isoform X2 [Lycorma delicatula]|uniref:uncharacterized protein LOC142332577 isoform X2 n=1 Tax=Lycorma delicatula TaxID=130591 RepID=UPI003F51A4F9